MADRYAPDVAETPIRDRKVKATRARIAETALDLFTSQGYAQTTIDHIAQAAGVGRRTIFRHFATKEAMLFDHFSVQRDVAIRRLQERPPGEPPLMSLHAVLREMCDEGYDRRVFGQIRAVLDSEPRIAGKELSVGMRAFEDEVITTLQRRCGQQRTALEIHALTLMAINWFVTAAHMYLLEDRPSLVECFDEVVATCVHSSMRDLG
jgi:AcrR family transcriptional regulator